jgi:hypothetical protein
MPARHLLIFTEDGGMHRPFTLMAVRSTGTTAATFLDSDGFFRSTATTASHLSAWPTAASSLLNAWIWAWQTLDLGCGFFYLKKLLSISNNPYHKEDIFSFG